MTYFSAFPPRVGCFSVILLASFFTGCDSVPLEQPAMVEEKAPEILLPELVSFNEHIQPILSEYCYHCHGPDAGTREPKDEPLRLDIAEEAFAVRPSLGRAAIQAGNPRGSKILELMRSADPDIIMPPPNSHKTMMPREIALIERWIEQGAEYQPHWAFAPIERPAVPAAANPIDHFIQARLKEEGLTPNPPDDPQRFHRRLALDTTGLPPEPAETAAFVKAYLENPEAAVHAEADRLLATTASAEHFTRHWLDAARYADTHGIHIDNYRAIWPYRDWVIRAFEKNMPWDQFTIEQIAGDLLPDRTLDQQVATGFNRCLATTGEGGAIAEEYDAIYAQDRVDTTSAIWLGLTASCAACHDHKFDPISTKEFYSLTAFFRNNTMKPMDGNNAEHAPVVFVPLMKDRAKWESLTGEIDAVTRELDERKRSGGSEWVKWQENPEFHFGRDIDSTLAVELTFNQPDGPLRGYVDKQPREWLADVKRVDGPFGKAPLISEEPIDLGDIASFSRGDQITLGGYFRMDGQTAGTLIGRVDPSDNQRGWELSLDNAKPVFLVSDSWDKAATKLMADRKLDTNKWHHIMVTFNGKVAGHQSVTMYIDGKRVRSGPDPNTVGGNIESKVPLRLGSRHGEKPKFTAGVAMQDFRFYRRLLAPEEILALPEKIHYNQIASIPASQRSKEQSEQLKKYYFTYVDGPSQEILKRRDKIGAERESIRARGSMSLVMEEKKEGEPFAHVLTRGVYSDKGEKVTADTPAVLPPMPPDAPKNRAGLARWLVDPANPLPARVTMNRTWYYFFGTGIVESTQDFGIMGSRPSHPKLLDWLAAEFISNGWNYREMLKHIVTSATYRQSGTVSAEKLEADPANLLLARGPRVRLDAEQIRDLALAASGTLSTTVGGPPVKPYQPEGIWEAVAMPQSNTRNYKEDKGEALYRRSLYTFWKRTAAPPSMEILNAPSREVSCVRRDRTNTPLQALVLLNDTQFVESSRALAAAAMQASGETDVRVDFITSRLLSRVLDSEERAFVQTTFDSVLATYRDHPEDAKSLIATGASPPPADLDPAELAAWTLVASQIFNLDEAVTR